MLINFLGYLVDTDKIQFIHPLIYKKTTYNSVYIKIVFFDQKVIETEVASVYCAIAQFDSGIVFSNGEPNHETHKIAWYTTKEDYLKTTSYYQDIEKAQKALDKLVNYWNKSGSSIPKIEL